MEEWKVRDLLESSTLYFTRADLAGDPLEGSYATKNVEISQRVYADMFGEEAGEAWAARLTEWNRAMPGWMYLNCWHANRGESSAMWSMYVQRGRGIAIQTTVARLHAAIQEQRDIALSQVSYIDFSTDRFPPGNAYPPFLHKALHLSWESEVRLLIEGELPCRYLLDPPPEQPGAASVRANVVVTDLLEAVIVAPGSGPNRVDEIEALLAAHNVNCGVHRSMVDSPPIY